MLTSTRSRASLKTAAMAAIGSLVFCTDCGNLLDGSSGNEKAILKCDVCGTENRGGILQAQREVRAIRS